MVYKIMLVAAGLCAGARAMPPLPGVTMPAGAVAERLRLGLDVPVNPVRDAGKKGVVNTGRSGVVTLVSGTKKFPVVLMRYPDADSAYPKSDFQKMLFGSWMSGSARDFYREVSYNRLDLTGSVYGWFQTDSNKIYYSYSQNDPVRLILEAAIKSDPVVNYADFDNDGDGFVDCFTVVHAGKGMEETGDGSDIWSHMWALSATNRVFTTNDPDPNIPGQFIKINVYTVDPERSAYSNHGTMACIGVFCHEWGHSLGLPDLYDTNGGGAGLGLWCLMAAGSWGGDYRTPWSPTHPCAWAKISLGWITPTVVKGIRTNRVNAIETDPQAYQLGEGDTPGEEYFLVENRQKIKFDQNLQNSGLLIYHIDENIIASRSPMNQVNAGGGLPYGVALVEADGREDLYNGKSVGDPSDPFPGTGHNTAFDSAFTLPAAWANDGSYMTCGIQGISASSASMSALMYTGGGASSRFRYANLDVGDFVLTVTENGALGYVGSSGFGGSGFKYPRYGHNWLYYASMTCGDGIGYVADNYYSPGGRDDGDFRVSKQPDGRLRFITPARRSDQDILGYFDDRGHPRPAGLSVRQRSMAYRSSGFDNFAIIEYTFGNEGNHPHAGLYAGMFADFDMGNSSKNSGAADSNRALAYCRQAENTNPTVGIKLLAPDRPSNVAAFDNQLYVHPFGGLPDSLKYRFISGSLRSDSVSNVDVTCLVAAGPFDLGEKGAPNDTMTVAFALIGATSLAMLEETGDSARAIYRRRNSVAEPPVLRTGVVCRLEPVSPNPSGGRMIIRYVVAESKENAGLALYDPSGRLVRDFGRSLTPKVGVNRLAWDGRDDSNAPLAAGVYFLRLRVGDRQAVEKIVRLK